MSRRPSRPKRLYSERKKVVKKAKAKIPQRKKVAKKAKAKSPHRLGRGRVISTAAALLLGCGVPCDVPDAGPRVFPRAIPPGSYCVDRDMSSPPDLSRDACSMWMCKQSSDCPPSLCPTAAGFGTCLSGTCVWK